MPNTESSDPALRKKFVQLIGASGMTQAEAADALGLSEGTISKKARGDLPVKKRDVDALERLVERHKRPDEKVPRGTSDQIDDHWSPNPALRGLIPKKAYDTALDYCHRLERAGVSTNLIEDAERLMIDGKYAQMNRRHGQELGEAGWVLLVDATFEIIREVLSAQGIVV